MDQQLGEKINAAIVALKGIRQTLNWIKDSKLSYPFVMVVLTRSPLDRPYGPMTNTGKVDFSGSCVQNIVHVLMAVFYNSLCFHPRYLTMLPLEKRRIIWVLTGS